MLLRITLVFSFVLSTIAQAAPTAEMKLVEGLIAARNQRDSQKIAVSLLEKYGASEASKDPQATDRYVDALEQMGLISSNQTVQYKIQFHGVKQDLAEGKIDARQAVIAVAQQFKNIGGAQFLGCTAGAVVGGVLVVGGVFALTGGKDILGILGIGLGAAMLLPAVILGSHEC